jgi:hypothetical protein
MRDAFRYRHPLLYINALATQSDDSELRNSLDVERNAPSCALYRTPLTNTSTTSSLAGPVSTTNNTWAPVFLLALRE